MKIINKIKSLFKKRQAYFTDNLLLEKNGKVVKNVNIKYNVSCSRNKKWPGRIIVNNLKITDHDLFFLLSDEFESSCTRIIGPIIVKKRCLEK